jgi:hypothetical protein
MCGWLSSLEYLPRDQVREKNIEYAVANQVVQKDNRDHFPSTPPDKLFEAILADDSNAVEDDEFVPPEEHAGAHNTRRRGQKSSHGSLIEYPTNRSTFHDTKKSGNDREGTIFKRLSAAADVSLGLGGLY